MNQYHVYLSSTSPRRRELLEQVGINYTVIKPEINETRLNDIDPLAYTQRLAISKALYAKQHIEDNRLQAHPIVVADTAVVLNNTILGKPQNQQDALDMLSQLSDYTHQVFSSVCLIYKDNTQTITQISDVTFRKLTKKEIHDYWSSGEPIDKAGAYGIQGIGAKFIKYLSGSYSSVMGLPLYELLCLLDNREI